MIYFIDFSKDSHQISDTEEKGRAVKKHDILESICVPTEHMELVHYFRVQEFVRSANVIGSKLEDVRYIGYLNTEYQHCQVHIKESLPTEDVNEGWSLKLYEQKKKLKMGRIIEELLTRVMQVATPSQKTVKILSTIKVRKLLSEEGI